jgi:hypothetical protein
MVAEFILVSATAVAKLRMIIGVSPSRTEQNWAALRPIADTHPRLH